MQKCVEGLISVIMGIYNCAETLGDAIESLMAQTYQNFEIIMCDDGSSDNTFEVAKSYEDKYPDKIVLIKNKTNMGLNYTLNHCLRYAKGEFVARMDGDDLCDGKRFEKEFSFLSSHPEYAIVSTPMYYFDENGVWGEGSALEKPTKFDIIKETPFCHAPCMVRKLAYDAVEGYSVDDKLLRVEDYHLWVKMYSKGYIGFNLQEPLYSMRDDRDAYARRKFRYRINEARVKLIAVKLLELPKYYYIYSLKPIIVGLLPTPIYNLIHKSRLSKQD